MRAGAGLCCNAPCARRGLARPGRVSMISMARVHRLRDRSGAGVRPLSFGPTHPIPGRSVCAGCLVLLAQRTKSES
eukprot:7381817-Prymnesium_polylepis.1